MTVDANAEVVIEVRNVTAGYGSRTIVRDVSFSVRRGEVFGILGGSGCGKSTLLKVMIGLLPPQAGSVLIEGEDITRLEGPRRRALLQRIGVTFQQGALFGSMTLLQNVRLALDDARTLPPDARDLVAAMKLAMVGLRGYEHLLPEEISGGMRKRAALARALALDPRMLFLDEPSAGLDPITSADLDKLIVRFSDLLGCTFVIVTHELPSIYAIVDRCILLEREARGAIAEGNPRELRDDPPSAKVGDFFKHLDDTELALRQQVDEPT